MRVLEVVIVLMRHIRGLRRGLWCRGGLRRRGGLVGVHVVRNTVAVNVRSRLWGRARRGGGALAGRVLVDPAKATHVVLACRIGQPDYLVSVTNVCRRPTELRDAHAWRSGGPDGVAAVRKRRPAALDANAILLERTAVAFRTLRSREARRALGERLVGHARVRPGRWREGHRDDPIEVLKAKVVEVLACAALAAPNI